MQRCTVLGACGSQCWTDLSRLSLCGRWYSTSLDVTRHYQMLSQCYQLTSVSLFCGAFIAALATTLATCECLLNQSAEGEQHLS